MRRGGETSRRRAESGDFLTGHRRRVSGAAADGPDVTVRSDVQQSREGLDGDEHLVLVSP